MKRIALGITIIAILILVGCNNVVTNNRVDTSTKIEKVEEYSEIGIVEQQIQSNNSSINNEIYDNETHKEIQYGKLSFDLNLYHIVSHMRSDKIETFMLELDEGEVRPQIHVTITIQTIKKQDLLNMESIMSYLMGLSQDYEKIMVYNNVTDDSGITSLYSVTGGGLTDYLVCYNDVCYLIESNYGKLDIFLLKNYPNANYEVNNQQIECANSFAAYVKETISFDINRVEYDIIQGKDGIKYYADLSIDEENQYSFVLKNEESRNLLTLSTYASDLQDVIKFLDINMDGYVDVQFLESSGTLNNSYGLYVWDNFMKSFIKVKCDEMLSDVEVYDGYLLNWQKADTESGIIQKLVWKEHTLIKESEEQY